MQLVQIRAKTGTIIGDWSLNSHAQRMPLVSLKITKQCNKMSDLIQKFMHS